LSTPNNTVEDCSALSLSIAFQFKRTVPQMEREKKETYFGKKIHFRSIFDFSNVRIFSR
jgi:hypothetical protein